MMYLVANRLAGDGRWLRALGWRGRPLWYAALAAFVVSLFFWDLQLAAWAAGTFLFWRTLGWWNAIDAGTNTETPGRDFRVMTLRGLFWAPIFIWYFQWWALLATVLVALAIAAIYHAAWHWVPRKPDTDRIPLAELMTGLFLDIVFWGIHFARA